MNNTRQKLEQAEADARKLAKRKPKNPNLAVEQRYREQVEEHFDIILPRFGKGQKSQVKNAVKRYGADTMLKAVDWLFDNWKTLRRNNPKFYGLDKYPPLRSLVSFSIMDRYLPYIQKGEQMKSNEKLDWHGIVADQNEQRPENEGHDELRELFGGTQ